MTLSFFYSYSFGLFDFFCFKQRKGTWKSKKLKPSEPEKVVCFLFYTYVVHRGSTNTPAEISWDLLVVKDIKTRYHNASHVDLYNWGVRGSTHLENLSSTQLLLTNTLDSATNKQATTTIVLSFPD